MNIMEGFMCLFFMETNQNLLNILRVPRSETSLTVYRAP